MIIVPFLLALFGVIVYFFVLHYGRQEKLINLIPGPSTIPILGNLHIFQVPPCELWNLLRKLGHDYYPIYRLWSFSKAIVNIRHPDDIEAILGNTKFIQKSEIYELLRSWFGTGLLTSSGRKWQVRRKILTPAFHFNVLQQFVNIFIEESNHVVKMLKREKGPVIKDLRQFASEHTLNVICETSMGISLKDKDRMFEYKYRKAVYDMGQIIVYRFIKPWLKRDAFFQIFPKGWEQFRILKILHGFSRQIIQERKQYHEQTNGQYLSMANNSSEQNDVLETRKRRLAMLDLLIAAHRNDQIDDEGIREEVDTFMFRGHDTTAMCIAFTIMLLAEHKEIQDRARAEVNAVMEEQGGEMTMSVLQNLQYLDRCIKESLRLYPSVPFISREIENDVRLSNYMVPAGTTVHLHIIDVHKDPRYWPNPEVFDPDRFLPQNIKGRHPYSYVPFSAGPRNCIGQRFAMLEVKATLGLLLRNFYFEPVDYLKDLTITTDLIIRPAHPIRTKFIAIENTC